MRKVKGSAVVIDDEEGELTSVYKLSDDTIMELSAKYNKRTGDYLFLALRKWGDFLGLPNIYLGELLVHRNFTMTLKDKKKMMDLLGLSKEDKQLVTTILTDFAKDLYWVENERKDNDS